MTRETDRLADLILTAPLTPDFQEAIRERAAMQQPGEVITIMREWCADLVRGSRGSDAAGAVLQEPASKDGQR